MENSRGFIRARFYIAVRLSIFMADLHGVLISFFLSFRKEFF